ncbi:hypothetical protein [Actinacidiphila acididurans]|jgi:hypothetical protein|uniref:Lipoprotein n=1 Tax=Actinacidiphila acididurans TaxID=2784346 RepID=A0ABS2TP97_9ACTN|nr:hypothetical protein [Actinacidiphila acididurans]MBM9505170.1 hypothetical protein [Actinacidiphila acididurans]
MSIRRAATTIGAISLGLVALSACDKPTPLATVTVGSRSVTAEAFPKCYANGAKLPSTIFRSCLEAAPKHHLTVGYGDTVRVGVDPKIANKGWLIANGTTLNPPQDLKGKTYWTLDSTTLFEQQDPQTGQTVPVNEVTLNIVESPDPAGSDIFGVWKIKLVKS